MARSRIIGIVLVLLLTSCGYTRSEGVQIDGEDSAPEAQQTSPTGEASAPNEAGPPPTALPPRPDIESKGNPADSAASMTFADGTLVEITFEQLDGVVQKTLDSSQYRLLAEVPEAFDTEVLRQMLVAEALQSELTARGIEVTDTETKEVEDELIANVSGALANQTDDPQADRSEEAAKLIQDVPLLTLVRDVEVRERTLLASLEEVAEPGQVPCVSHILLADENAAQEVSADLEGGADFGELAAEKSTDPGSSEAEGVLGCSDPQQFPDEFKTAVEEATVGQATAPVQTEAGWHVILVTGNELEEIEPAALAEREFGTILNDRFETAEITIDPNLGTWDKEQNSLVPA